MAISLTEMPRRPYSPQLFAPWIGGTSTAARASSKYEIARRFAEAINLHSEAIASLRRKTNRGPRRGAEPQAGPRRGAQRSQRGSSLP